MASSPRPRPRGALARLAPTPGAPALSSGNAAFNEYLNWALVNLRVADYAEGPEAVAMMTAVDGMMVRSRGFPRFAELTRFLVPLYRDRPPGTALASLYPQIIAWFEAQNRASPGR